MSKEQLHDLLVQIEQRYDSSEMLEHEHQLKLDAMIESLEQQVVYPDDFDQFSALQSRAGELALKYEQDYPKTSAALKSIVRILGNMAH